MASRLLANVGNLLLNQFLQLWLVDVQVPLRRLVCHLCLIVISMIKVSRGLEDYVLIIGHLREENRLIYHLMLGRIIVVTFGFC